MVQWIIRKQLVVRSNQIKNQRGHRVNKKTSCGDCVDPKMFKEIHLEQKGPSSLKKMSTLSLNYPILRGCINIKGLMENHML